MKALSVRQPWASLIARGIKTIETRTWPTRYRGELLVVSTARPAIHPCGQALCVARLFDCRPMRKGDWLAAHCPEYHGAYAWVLDGVKPISPFPVKGRLGIYDIDLPINFSA